MAIRKYKGTILIISHDRYFLDQTVNRVVEIENKRITNYNGNYSWYRQMKRLEKIGIYGPNGCGKSTLIKAMLGLNDVEGELKINKNRKIGYISQDVIDLNDEATVLELFSVDNRDQLGELRTELFLMGFASESLNKKIAVLSLGERMKLKLLLMIREKCDILILDEPTNHIDLHVREQLEEALAKYNGTIILVTHDRYMLEKICNKLLVFENKSIKRCEYGFAEYLNKKKEQAENNANKKLAEEKIILDNKLAYIIGQLSTLNKESQEYKKFAEEYTEILKLKRIYS